MRVALLLAGGEGRRFGRRDKLLETIGGETLLARSLRAAGLATRRTILILPPGFARRRALVTRLYRPRLVVRTAADARAGIGASLAAGIAALRPIDREAMIFLADMPFARAHRGRLSPGRDAVRPMRAGVPGHPVLIRASAVKSLTIVPASGLGALIDRRRIDSVVGSASGVLDIDTPAALRRLRHRIATPAGAFRLTNEDIRC